MTDELTSRAARLRARLGNLGGRARGWARQREFWFLLAIALVMIIGGAMRSYRLDMPPIDYPEDRQRSNMLAIDVLIRGDENQRASWMELRVYPAIVALVYPVGKMFGAEAWTVARTCSAFFGTLTIGFTALAGWLMAPSMRVGGGRRWLMALLMACAIAFNPYHAALSRVTTTEPLTIMFQAAALAAFLAAMRWPGRIWLHGLFVLTFGLACLSKLPSMMWAPAFLIGYLLHPAFNWRWRIVAAAVAGCCVIAILLILKLNPFKIFESYSETFNPFVETMQDWIGHPLWTKTYFSTLVAVMRLPLLLLALVGLVVAPWIYRITGIVFLVGFYFVTNLNSYNFAHGILPMTCLAVWGLTFMLEAGSLKHLGLGAEAAEPTARPVRLAHRAWGAALATAIFIILWPVAPKANGGLDGTPKGFYMQAVDVIGKIVPLDQKVLIDDSIVEYHIKHVTGRTSENLATQTNIDTSGGWYYSFRRFGQTPLAYASMGWVRWASMPGEFEGILYTLEPLTIGTEELGEYLQLSKDALVPAQGGLDLEALLVPRAKFDAAERVVRVTPGESLTLGMQWNNMGDYRLATLASRHETWQLFMPMPLRQGGVIVNRGAMLNVAHAGRRLMRYTFEFPPFYPPGRYTLAWYPFAAAEMTQAGRRVQPVTLPVQVEVVSPAPAAMPIDLAMVELYPDRYDYAPTLWTEEECYSEMRPEGVTHGGDVTHLMATPGAPAGKYRLTLRGSGVPIYDARFPENLWPTVRVFLPGQAPPVAEIPFAGEETDDFFAEFDAPAGFDSLRLDVKIIGAAGGRTPTWRVGFVPGSFGPEGMQYIDMRRARLERVDGEGSKGQ